MRYAVNLLSGLAVNLMLYLLLYFLLPFDGSVFIMLVKVIRQLHDTM